MIIEGNRAPTLRVTIPKVVAVEVAVPVTVVVAGKVIVEVAVMVTDSFGPAVNRFHDGIMKRIGPLRPVVCLGNCSGLDQDRPSLHVRLWDGFWEITDGVFIGE